ncbi:MAG: peptidoglycan DD-metalloendopeptidase family protein [Bacteroidia bacterium]|nr:peptidoglycan DD-metalloendopeptidase family protein [Bacteroidia bacterium]
MRKNKIIILLICFYTISFGLFAQTKKELEQRKKDLQKEIRLTNQMLEETKKNKQLSLNQLLTLNKKINIREELIGTITDEVGLLEKQIEDKKENIALLKNDLAKLKDEYAKMIYFAYKNQSSYNRLMFILSSKDFNQAYYRLKYLQQYSDYRLRQAELIIQKQKEITQKLNELQDKRNEKLGIVKEKEVEVQKLSGEKDEKEKILINLQDKEKQLRADLKKKQRDAEKLQQAIQQLIAEEIRKAKEEAARKAAEERRKAEREAAAAKAAGKSESEVKKIMESGKTTAPKISSSGMYLSAEAEKLSSNFEQNKGHLPWPVAEGVITSTFGEHEHPVLKNIKTKNNGVDITTTKNAMARAIFDGEVSGVISIPDAGEAIIIRHGEYLSVYSNLKEVYVKKGDKVKTKQSIAITDIDNESGKSEVHLEIWKGNVTLNPELWIKR